MGDLKPTQRRTGGAQFLLWALLFLSACGDAAGDVAPAATAARPCPSWVDFPADHHSNAGSPYLGCAEAANLRAMLDNPADLDRGRNLGPANGAREAIGVGAYEQGQLKGFKDENAPQPLFVMPPTAGGAGP